MVPWTHSSPQSKQHLYWFSGFDAVLTVVTDRLADGQTDHATPYSDAV